jgi:type II pantothenate kinase
VRLASRTVGLDVGATLCKLAVIDGGIATEHHPSTDVVAIRARVEALRPERVMATGGGASELGGHVGGLRIGHAPEFDAWTRGAPIVAGDERITLPARYLLVSLGTGTSILDVGPGGSTRVGGTGLGGGAALGLGRLLLGVDSFADLVALAARGDRRRVDLLVADVYRGAAASIAGDLTASNFAKLSSTRPEDLAHALMGLVGESVALVALGLARGAGVDTIVYCGSTLEGNPALGAIVHEITARFGHRPLFLARGAYCGAVGAAAFAEDAPAASP